MLRVALACAALAACGSSAPAPVAPPPKVSMVNPEVARAESKRAERERRDKLAAAHRELEAEQQGALAATCDKPPGTQERCEPSCYRGEGPDPRVAKKVARAEIVHLVCRTADAPETGPIVFADEIGGAKIAVRVARGRVPKAHKKGSWQAEIATAAIAALLPEVARGDAVRVTGAWKLMAHPVTKDKLRCVTVSHFTSIRRPLDACGGRGGMACEAMGNAAVHGINVVHFRLAEARQLHATGKDAECQRAALEAVAVARGMPRWRQYVSLNANQWKSYPRYRTRFDGILDEETLFTTAGVLGSEAQGVYADCGGGPTPKTLVDQEQSFHTCW
ncbi:MAG: hypothetical protein ABI175_13990 [Polyangiales bacterium]